MTAPVRWHLGAAAAAIAVAVAGCSRPDGGAARLASEHGCMRCHDVASKVVGPSFARIADRYRADPSAPDRLADKVRQGSVGNWGRVVMPRQPQVTADEARVLADWVLSTPSAGD